MSDILSQWEAEANEPLLRDSMALIQWDYIASNRILALIELIRKKDEALSALFKDYCELAESEWSPSWDNEEYMNQRWPLVKKTKEALALTEQLK